MTKKKTATAEPSEQVMAETPRPYMTVEGDVMAACGTCAGEVKHRDGHLICSLEPPIPECRLMQLVSEAAPPISPADKKADTDAAKRRRASLLVMANPNWIMQNIRNTEPLPKTE